MKAITTTTHSPDETRELGRAIGSACGGGEIILLEGDLGAGKTTLTQGLALGLGVGDPVISPTFIMLREYTGALNLYHFDFYRLEEAQRAADVEFDEYLYGNGVSVVEWPSRVPWLARGDHLSVHLHVVDPVSRAVQVHAVGDRYQAIHAAVAQGVGGARSRP